MSSQIGINVINRSEYFLCQASITILLISGVNYDNNSRNEGIPGQLTMSVAAYLNLWIFRFWLCYLNYFWCIWKFCILLVLLFCWSLVIWKSDKHVEVTLCLNLWESVMIGITLETTAHDDSLKIFLPVLAGGGCSCWIWPKQPYWTVCYTNCQRCTPSWNCRSTDRC